MRVWLDANPADREIVARLSEATEAPADVDVEAALARVHARIRDERHERGSPWRFALIAALPIAAVIGAVIVYRGRTAATNDPSRTIATGVGQRDSVQLADGSRVVIGPQSRLVIPGDYASQRTVTLTGDAYFDVQHDAAHPFSVRTANAVIQDIGTTFAVESDPAALTTVSVLTGSVRLRGHTAAPDAGVVLAAGDRGTVNAAGESRAERQVVRDEDLSWTRGSPSFRDEPISTVVAEIQRWYGVTVIVADSSLRDRRITASFNGEPVDRVLNILGLLLGAKVEQHGDTATISAAGGASGSR